MRGYHCVICRRECVRGVEPQRLEDVIGRWATLAGQRHWSVVHTGVLIFCKDCFASHECDDLEEWLRFYIHDHPRNESGEPLHLDTLIRDLRHKKLGTAPIDLWPSPQDDPDLIGRIERSASMDTN